MNWQSGLRIAFLAIGAVLLAFSIYFLYGAFYMVGMMGRYGCMGMMCGPMMYYPLVFPTILLAVGVFLVVFPLVVMRQYGEESAVASQVGKAGDFIDSSVDVNRILRLLPKQERDVMNYIIKNGGEVYQYMITKDLGIPKVRAWRIVRRLEEKGLVEIAKVKGRNLIRAKLDSFKGSGNQSTN